jgi:hypothetical protein
MQSVGGDLACSASRSATALIYLPSIARLATTHEGQSATEKSPLISVGISFIHSTSDEAAKLFGKERAVEEQMQL